MLARDVDLLDRNFLEQLDPKFEFLGRSELGNIAAENQEVGGRVHRLNVGDGAHGLVDEALVD